MPKISVIIPVYNSEMYLAETLDSLISQSFTDWEAICINDGSTDNSEKILQKYAKQDKRIKVFSRKNAGVVTVRNEAVSKAKSEYIYPLDSDDIIMPQTLEKLYNAMIAGYGDIITCQVQCFGKYNYYCEQPLPNKINMSHRNCLVNAALFKKSDFKACGGYDHAFDCALEDYDLWLNMIFNHNKKIYRVPEVLFYYRLKNEQDSRNYQNRSKHKKIYRILLKKYPRMRVFRLLKLMHKIILKPFYLCGKILRFMNTKKVKILYFDDCSNFGDQLNVTLLSYMGYDAVKTSRKKCDIVAIGSLMENFFVSNNDKIIKHPVIVYGTGFIKKETGDTQLYRALDVRAVRGYNTLNRLKYFDNVNISDNVVVADPGLLSGLLLNGYMPKKKYKLGIIPHYVDATSPLLKKIKCKNMTLIDITSDPFDFIQKVSECECIISSAMHGLIAADALGVPNMRMILSDNIVGGDYKYDDYYSAFGIKKHNKIDLRKKCISDKDIEYIKRSYPISCGQVYRKQMELINSFPYKISPEFKNKIQGFIKRTNGVNNGDFSNDLISVIIPAYNSASSVLRCIRSVCNQTYKNLEIIVVYKKSTDDTLKIIKSVKDSRIRVIEQVENTGPGGARNIGMDNANGKWLGFVEADDYIDSDFYEKLLKAAVDNDCDIAQGNIIFDNWHSVKKSGIYSTYYDKLSVLQNGASFDKLFNSRLIKTHNIRFAENIRWEDNIFIFKSLYYGKLILVPDTNYTYEPSKWTKEYTQILKGCIVPACSEIIQFINSVKLSRAEKKLAKQKLIKCVAISFIYDKHIYHELMKLLENPFFLKVLYYKTVFKRKHNKKDW